MFLQKLVPIVAGFVFVAVPVFAFSELWPAANPGPLPPRATRTVVDLPIPAERTGLGKPRDLRSQGLDSVTLLNHWQYTSYDLIQLAYANSSGSSASPGQGNSLASSDPEPQADPQAGADPQAEEWSPFQISSLCSQAKSPYQPQCVCGGMVFGAP